MGRLVTIRRVFMGEESFVVRVRVSEKKTNKTKCIVILVAKILIAMVDFIVGRFVSSN